MLKKEVTVAEGDWPCSGASIVASAATGTLLAFAEAP